MRRPVYIDKQLLLTSLRSKNNQMVSLTSETTPYWGYRDLGIIMFVSRGRIDHKKKYALGA